MVAVQSGAKRLVAVNNFQAASHLLPNRTLEIVRKTGHIKLNNFEYTSKLLGPGDLYGSISHMSQYELYRWELLPSN